MSNMHMLLYDDCDNNNQDEIYFEKKKIGALFNVFFAYICYLLLSIHYALQYIYIFLN